MSVPTSTAPAVRQWLFDQCSAGLAPDPANSRASLLVCFDNPGPYEPEDVVAIGAVRRRLNAAAMIGGGGAGWLDEAYSVQIVIDVFRAADSGQVAYQRATDLVDAVVAIVRSDLTLGGHVIKSVPSGDSTEVEWNSEHAGKQATATVTIDCVMRI